MTSPPSRRQIDETRLTRRLLWVCTLLTPVVYVGGLLWTKPPVAVDGWSNFELSNTVFRDFYKANTQRQMEVHSPYSTAFPPLWPTLIAVSRKVCDFGFYNVYFLNLLFSMAILFSLARLFQRIDCSPLLGIVAYWFLFSLYYYVDNCWEGLNAPVTVWLFIEGVNQLLSPKTNVFQSLLAGMFFGLACLSRFDMAFAALFAGGFLGMSAARHDGWKAGVGRGSAYFAAVVLVLAPWMAYCQEHFGSLLVSDNSRQVKSAMRHHVLEYFPKPLENDLIAHPIEWLKGLLTWKFPTAISSGIKAIVLSPLPIFAILALIVWWFRQKTARSPLSAKAKAFLCLAGLMVFAMPIPGILTGYAHPRYWIITVLIIFMSLLIMLQHWRPEIWNRRNALLATSLLAAMGLVQIALVPGLREWAEGTRREAIFVPMQATQPMRDLAEAVRQDAGEEPHQMIYMGELKGGNRPAAMYGALTGDTILICPLNIKDVFASYINDWSVTHVYDADGLLSTIDKGGIELVPTSFPCLYRVQRPLGRP